VKEVNHYGREEEVCKEASRQEEGHQEEVTTSSPVF
jgi:hypothetical protein